MRRRDGHAHHPVISRITHTRRRVPRRVSTHSPLVLRQRFTGMEATRTARSKFRDDRSATSYGLYLGAVARSPELVPGLSRRNLFRPGVWALIRSEDTHSVIRGWSESNFSDFVSQSEVFSKGSKCRRRYHGLPRPCLKNGLPSPLAWDMTGTEAHLSNTGTEAHDTPGRNLFRPAHNAGMPPPQTECLARSIKAVKTTLHQKMRNEVWRGEPSGQYSRSTRRDCSSRPGDDDALVDGRIQFEAQTVAIVLLDGADHHVAGTQPPEPAPAVADVEQVAHPRPRAPPASAPDSRAGLQPASFSSPASAERANRREDRVGRPLLPGASLVAAERVADGAPHQPPATAPPAPGGSAA